MNGKNIEVITIVEKVVQSLTMTFEHIIVAIKESKDLSTLMIDELLGLLQAYKWQLKEKS